MNRIINRIITKIASLFTTKKSRIVAILLAITLITGGTMAISNTVSANEVWAVLLNFFGKANVTGNVWQSVLLDGGRYNAGDDTRIQSYTTNDIFAGETIISIHDLKNRSSIEQNVALTTSYSSISIASAIESSYYELETLEDTRNQEKVWGGDPDIVTLTGQLKVSVSYEGSDVVFKATPPSDYDSETSLTTFTFDTDSDDIADFQVQYDGNDEWVYSEVDESVNTWIKDITGWEEVPSDFVTEFANGEFTLKVPMSILGGLGSDYKFGVQANGLPSHQIFYSTDPAHLWYAEGDYVHSTYYMGMTLGIEILEDTSFMIEPNEIVDFAMSNKTDSNLVCKNCTVTVIVEPR